MLRTLVHETAPGVTEKISYDMPTFMLNGNLIYFAAYKKHIGLYPGTSVVEAFRDRLGGYKLQKGTVQFPLTEPLPADLLRDIIRFRIRENDKKVKSKKRQ